MVIHVLKVPNAHTCCKLSCLDHFKLKISSNLFSSGAQCKNGICECSEGLVYTRGKCRTLVGLNSECRDVTKY